MALRRFYFEHPGLQIGSTFTIGGELFHHIRDVCRFKQHDQFEILTGDGSAKLCEIRNISKRDLSVEVTATRLLAQPAKPAVTLALSVPKLPKVDWIIEKCVELGVTEIRPFVSEHSFLRKAGEISDSRLKRWRKLVEAATQQSGRGDLMQITPAETLKGVLTAFNRQPRAAGLFPYEGEAQLRLREAIQEVKRRQAESVWLFVGSEGGFSIEEVALFSEYGMKPVSMGQQILRVETACVALVSIIKYEYEHIQ